MWLNQKRSEPWTASVGGALAPLIVMIFNVSAQVVSNRSDTKTQGDCKVANLRCGACVQMPGRCVRITCGTLAESNKKLISWCSARCSNLPSKASHSETISQVLSFT